MDRRFKTQQMTKIYKKLMNNTNDKIIQCRHLILKLSFMIFVVFLVTGILHETAQAATGLKIYNYATKKETTYADQQIKVTLNGTAIGISQLPGILVNGVALVPYDEIFEKSDIAADCVYDSKKGTITISKNGKSVKMTIGSKKATANGKSVTLSAAPMRIKYVSENINKVLVPSRFVSENLGLGYTWNSSKSTVAIVKKTMTLAYDGGKKFEYTGAQGKVTFDGKTIDLGNMPSIITNDTAMLRAKRVFADSSIKASYNYSSADKKVTLKKGDKVLEMTIGSTTAYLNGKAVKMDTAPMIVKNYQANISYVMVPGSFTATSLGYDYSWNNSSVTSVITTHKSSSGNSGSAPELGGDDSVVINPGTILGQWTGNQQLYSSSSNVHTLNEDAPAVTNPATLTSVIRDFSNSKLNSETFMFHVSGTFGKIVANQVDKTISVQASGVSCIDQTYQMYGVSSNVVNTIGVYNNAVDLSSIYILDLLTSDCTYEVSLSSDKQILYVTVYYNALTSAVVGTNSNGDYITLTGMEPLQVTANHSTDMIIIDLPYTANALGELNISLTGAKYLTMFNVTSQADRTQLVLGVNDGYEYYIAENGNQYSLLFELPGTGAPQQPTQPDTPTVTDPSEYEIRIPKPAGITRSMLTDEDDYFNNRFMIKLPGDYTSQLNNIINTADTVKDITVALNANNETVLTFKTTKLQGYEYAVDDSFIYVKVGNPRDIYKNIVILDPGHGGAAAGAHYFNTDEKDINFKILYTLGKKYFNSDTSKLKVYYTRIKDVDMSLSDRAAFAKKYGADLFVSLHMNANLSSSPYGTEVYYATNNNSPNSAGLTSQKLADIFADSISASLGTKNRGSRAERYTVVYKNTVPAVLIELGFLSNKSDFEKLSDPTFQEDAARTIYETLLDLFEDYPTGR